MIQPVEKRSLLHRLVKRIDVRCDVVDVTVRPGAIAPVVSPALSAGGLRLEGEPEDDEPVTVLSIPTRLRRTGKENRLVMEAASSGSNLADRSLLRVLAQAHLFQEMVMKGNGASIGDLAQELGATASYFTRIVRLSFIAPSVTKAILDGRQPKRLSAKRLTVGSFQIAKSWKEQVTQLGVTPS